MPKLTIQGTKFVACIQSLLLSLSPALSRGFASNVADFISFRSLTKENEVAAGAWQAIMSAGGSQLLDHFWALVMAGSLPLSLVRYHEYKFIFKSLVAFYSYHLEMYNLLFCFTIIGKEKFNCLMLQ